MTGGDRGTGAMSRSRLETFADGVFAIAATLLILNVDSQVGTQPHGLGGWLLHIWPSYLAYAVSSSRSGSSGSSTTRSCSSWEG